MDFVWALNPVELAMLLNNFLKCILPKEANLYSLPHFFLMIRSDFFTMEATVPMCGLDKLFLFIGFLCRINELTLLIAVLAIFLEEKLKILCGKWSSTFQCSPDYDVLFESLHTSFQHAYAPLHSKRNISILSFNFCEIWVNMQIIHSAVRMWFCTPCARFTSAIWSFVEHITWDNYSYLF